MMKINAIELAAGIGCDVEDEIRDLEALMAEGETKSKAIRRQFSHIDSLLTGMRYVINYTEEEETRHELSALIDRMREDLLGLRREAMQIVYSAEIGRKVRIQPDAPGTWSLSVAGNEIVGASIYYGLKSMNEVKETFCKHFC